MALELTAAGFVDTLHKLNCGSHVALAVSGGGDSMAMLALAADAQKLSSSPTFSVLTVNHGLRPEALAEAEMVATQCRNFGMEHEILNADIALSGSDIQQQARRMRYRLMGAWCARHAVPLVLAHHQDDQAETVLMRLARGSGIDGLAAMSATRTLHLPSGPLQLIRPFLGVASEDLRRYALATNMPIANDPSNHNSDFERVRWRQLMPQLADMGIDAARLAALAGSMQQTRDTLNRRLHDWLADIADWHDYGVLGLPRGAFLALPEDYQARLLSRYVRYFGGLPHPKKRRQITRLYQAVADRQNGAMTLGGIAVRWRRDRLFLGREAAACPSYQLNMSESEWDRRFLIRPAADSRKIGAQIKPLGAAGVQAARDAGFRFDDAVPAAYFAALPAITIDGGALQCPIIDRNCDVDAYNIAEQAFSRDIFV